MIYRVEIRKDGSIVSCDVVESALKNGGLVCYVDAESKAEACTAAKKQWCAWHRARNARKLVHIAQHLCVSCGKTSQKRLCLACNDKASKTRREREAILRLPDAEKAIALAERAREIKKQREQHAVIVGSKNAAIGTIARMAKADRSWDSGVVSPIYKPALRQCLRAYDRDPAGFRAWLLAKLGQNTAVAAE